MILLCGFRWWLTWVLGCLGLTAYVWFVRLVVLLAVSALVVWWLVDCYLCSCCVLLYLDLVLSVYFAFRIFDVWLAMLVACFGFAVCRNFVVVFAGFWVLLWLAVVGCLS